MKKLFRAACAGIALTAALTATALAADYNTECADHLKDMNLFHGTTQGYQLDRAPTRAEAAAMLVRLLGKEEEAKALTYTAPFTDLSGWEKPYVQYLYENGLTRGATATTFAPGGRCTAQMYAAFLLRALGYTEADGDFAYANAVAFAEQTGVYDAITIDTVDFLRDDAAAASYAALAQTAKDSGEMLLTQLVASGAVEAQRAEPYQKLFRTYNRYLDAVKGMREVTALSVGQELTLDAGSFKLRSSEQTATDLTALRSLTERTVTLSATGAADKTFNAESYVEDGSRYQTVNGVRSRRALTEEEQEGLFAGYGVRTGDADRHDLGQRPDLHDHLQSGGRAPPERCARSDRCGSRLDEGNADGRPEARAADRGGAHCVPADADAVHPWRDSPAQWRARRSARGERQGDGPQTGGAGKISAHSIKKDALRDQRIFFALFLEPLGRTSV